VTGAIFRNGQLLDPEGKAPSEGQVLVEAGRIRAVLRPDEAGPGDWEPVDLRGGVLAPGFIDLHTHGSAIFHDAGQLHDALDADAALLARHGVTSFLVTTIARPVTQLSQRVKQLAAWITQSREDRSVALGIHLEGPWISPAAAGAQPTRAIASFDARHDASVFDLAEGLVQMVTLAPEVEGAGELLSALERRGIVPALGHSLAGAEQVATAVSRGARHVTHLFNAMGSFHHRAPGLAGAALGDDRLSCDLICDGAHVHPAAVAAAVRAKGPRLALISDRIEPPEGAREASALGSGRPIRHDGVAWRLDDGRLAGSRVTLDAALRNLRRFAGASAREAVAACTLVPARILGVEAERGTLRPGARADFAVLDAELRPRETWIAGRRVYGA